MEPNAENSKRRCLLRFGWWDPKLVLTFFIPVMSEGSKPSQGGSISTVGLPFSLGGKVSSYFCHQGSKCQQGHTCLIIGHCSDTGFCAQRQRSSLSNSMCLPPCFNSMMLTSFNQANFTEWTQNPTSGIEIKLNVQVWTRPQVGIGFSGMTAWYCWVWSIQDC